MKKTDFENGPATGVNEACRVFEALNAMAGRHGNAHPSDLMDNSKMMSLLTVYQAHDELEVTRLIEGFNQMLHDFGVELHVANYHSPCYSKE